MVDVSVCIRCLDNVPHPFHDNGDWNSDGRYQIDGPPVLFREANELTESGGGPDEDVR